ncbi:2Fe-2S iron-sulfur cluster binding domain-containing protein [Shewanella avicenniae]|uniref:2Fe-2S iron-sulfur cluster binding domain-containing protein n=1 Tax=Shewanella avicenniae TaxID=2814294 RepID=A0ABX7QNV9_9GAMM|nr:FAD-binding oxidoreductase [Shewanella avicenniae]QSX32692.1 2Fe-2S iron-sulfur cluster binding domain-containing protein [Shewanella avicenniae]
MTSKITLFPADINFQATQDATLLESALSAGVVLEHSCKNGSCGLCESKLLAGSVIDTEGKVYEAQQSFLTCQCKANSNEVAIEAEYFPELAELTKKISPAKVSAAEYNGEFLTLKFRLPPTANFRYLAGQYINLHYNGLVRSYSVANADSAEGIELHIRKVPAGAMSEQLFNVEVAPNTLMRIEGPIGTFFVREDQRPIIFLAGGTGFAPVKAMVEQLLAAQSQREIHIYWGMRTAADFYSTLPNDWASQYAHIKFVPVVSEDDVTWQGRSGLVHQAVLSDFTDLSAFCVYACGSPLMINAAKADFVNYGLSEKKFFSDAFTVSK